MAVRNVLVSLVVFLYVFVFLSNTYTLRSEINDLNDLNADLEEKYVCVRNDLSREKEKTEMMKDRLSSMELPVYSYTHSDIELLAKVAETEAGTYFESPNAQKYVVQVVLNRVKSGKFPSTIEETVYQKLGKTPQFSVAYNGALDRCVPSAETYRNVYEVLMFGTDMPDYVQYFYSTSVKGNWVNNLNTFSVVEGTVFAYQ